MRVLLTFHCVIDHVLTSLVFDVFFFRTMLGQYRVNIYGIVKKRRWVNLLRTTTQHSRSHRFQAKDPPERIATVRSFFSRHVAFSTLDYTATWTSMINVCKTGNLLEGLPHTGCYANLSRNIVYVCILIFNIKCPNISGYFRNQNPR